MRTAVQVPEADVPVGSQVGVLARALQVEPGADLARHEAGAGPSRPRVAQLHPEVVVRRQRSAPRRLQRLLKVEAMHCRLSCAGWRDITT